MRVLHYASLCQSASVALLKKPVTVRLNPDLLAEVRQLAARDNRSLTNFIETDATSHYPWFWSAVSPRQGKATPKAQAFPCCRSRTAWAIWRRN